MRKIDTVKIPAEKLGEIITLILREFGLDVDKHIVCIVTDGPNVMQKLASVLNVPHIICLDHTLHLVISTLYKKGKEMAQLITEQHIMEDVQDENDEYWYSPGTPVTLVLC